MRDDRNEVEAKEVKPEEVESKEVKPEEVESKEVEPKKLTRHSASKATKEAHAGRLRTVHFEVIPISGWVGDLPVKEEKFNRRIRNHVEGYRKLLALCAAPVFWADILSSKFQTSKEGDAGLYIDYEKRDALLAGLADGKGSYPLYELRNVWLKYAQELAETSEESPDFLAVMWDLARAELVAKIKQKNDLFNCTREFLAANVKGKPTPSFQHAAMGVKYFPNVETAKSGARMAYVGNSRVIWLKWDKRLGAVPFLLSGDYLYEDKKASDDSADGKVKVRIDGKTKSIKKIGWSWAYLFHKFSTGGVYWSSPKLRCRMRKGWPVFTIDVPFVREPRNMQTIDGRRVEVVFDQSNPKEYMIIKATTAKEAKKDDNRRVNLDPMQLRHLSMESFLEELNFFSKRIGHLEARIKESITFGKFSPEYKRVKAYREAIKRKCDIKAMRIKERIDCWAKCIVKNAERWQCGHVKVYNLPDQHLLKMSEVEKPAWPWPWYQFKAVLTSKCKDFNIKLEFVTVEGFDKVLNRFREGLSAKTEEKLKGEVFREQQGNAARKKKRKRRQDQGGEGEAQFG